MKIVTLLGSPRSTGNSSTIAKHLAEAAVKLGAQSSIYELNRLSYRGCQGCYACKKSLDCCGLKDDLTEVLAAVQEADAVVLATPVYYGDITTQLKGYVDRSFSFLKPDYLTNPEPSRLGAKKLVFVLTQGHPDETFFSDIFPRYETFMKWMGFTDISLIRTCGVGPSTVDQVPQAALQQAEEAARALMG